MILKKILESLMTLGILMTREILMNLIWTELVLKIFQEEDFKNQKEDSKQQKMEKLIMTKSQSINVMSTLVQVFVNLIALAKRETN